MSKEENRGGKTYDSYEAFRLQFYDRERPEKDENMFGASFGKTLAKTILQEHPQNDESSR